MKAAGRSNHKRIIYANWTTYAPHIHNEAMPPAALETLSEEVA
jgi:hypothetical protein